MILWLILRKATFVKNAAQIKAKFMKLGKLKRMDSEKFGADNAKNVVPVG